MICPNCSSTEGHYSNIEDFNPGSDPEWSYYECWTCYNCESSFYSYEDGFEYGNEMITKQQANEIMRLHYRVADLQEAASSADQSGYVNQAKKYEEQEVEALKKLHEFVNSLVEEQS